MAKRSKENESAYRNSEVFNYYVERLTELAISMFEWVNIPSTIDARFLELTLFSNGMSIFFNDEVMGYLALQVAIGGKLNVYNIPTMRRAFASNGYNNELSENNSVIIYNNMLHTNCIGKIEMFAKRLYDLDRTIDINAKVQKTPFLITCDETQRLTMKNLYAQYMGNEPAIFGSKNLDINAVKVLKTDAPFIGNQMYELKTYIWNEALSYLGISSVNNVKRERLITDEVQRNLGGTVASRYSRLNMRKQACEEINKMFGLDIDVKYREDFTQLVESVTGEVLGNGGEDNE